MVQVRGNCDRNFKSLAQVLHSVRAGVGEEGTAIYGQYDEVYKPERLGLG